MKLWLVLIAISAADVMAFAQSGQKVGSVYKFLGQGQGRWCRQTTVLNGDDPVYLQDDIRYCFKPLQKDDGIVIRFDANPNLKPANNQTYDRPYQCSTAGICDGNSTLWLQGAYNRSNSSMPGTNLISVPRTTSMVLPDTIIEQGQSWTIENSKGVTVAGSHTAVGGTGPTLPPHFLLCSFTGNKVGTCASNPGDVARLAPGVYGIFREDNVETPVALVGIVPPHSRAEAQWNKNVPDAYKNDQSPSTVVERRLYLLNLVGSQAR
jgi:hypothetical protein